MNALKFLTLFLCLGALNTPCFSSFFPEQEGYESDRGRESPVMPVANLDEEPPINETQIIENYLETLPEDQRQYLKASCGKYLFEALKPFIQTIKYLTGMKADY